MNFFIFINWLTFFKFFISFIFLNFFIRRICEVPHRVSRTL